MSKLSDLIIRRTEAGSEQLSMFGTASPSPEVKQIIQEKEPQHPSDTYGEYWRLCFNVVTAAGEFAEKEKLLMNLRDESKKGSVLHVLEKYYENSPEKVKERRNEASKRFFAAVDQVNWYAVKHDLCQSSAMVLLGMLEDKRIRAKFKEHINEHIRTNHPPFELDELPKRDFRRPRK